MTTLIQNGTLVTAEAEFTADILVEDGKIRAIGQNLGGADQIIDARGKYVLPGGVDQHVHFSFEFNGTKVRGFESSKAAAAGGTTTVIEFVNQIRGKGLVESVEDYRKANRFFRGGQIFGAAAMAFMHGAQDGQKFMGVFLLGMALAQGQAGGTVATVPIWLMILCSLVMGVGTSIGGLKIIKSVGLDMVKLEKYQGFSADLAGAGCLLIASLTGIPVSTTHTKTTAIMGVGAAKRVRSVNWGIVKDMVLTWVLTFPGCGAIGYLMPKLFMLIF